MSNGAILDVVLLVVLLGYAVSGLRQGFVVGLFSLAGFLGGALLGMAFVPDLLGRLRPGLGRTILVLLGVLVVAWAVQAVGVLVGSGLRRALRWRPARAVDSVLGAVAGVVAVSLVTWFVAGAVRGSPSPTIARAVASSRVVAAIDAAVPVETGPVFAEFRNAVEGATFPRVFAGLDPESIRPVDSPDPAVAEPAARAAAGAVVKVEGVAQECARAVEGSGFVVAPERVVTNAHVVAGVDTPSVQVTGLGQRFPGTVVVFDPQLDLAVLAVPGLPAPPLALGQDLVRGDPAVVAGFPLDGPYAWSPARVREVVDARGEDIYGAPGVVREVYSLFAEVERGSSGGPVLNSAGAAVGVVFARSLDDRSTGYALTLAQSAPVLQAAAAAATPVDTGPCLGT